jgi:general secretion pathway protein E
MNCDTAKIQMVAYLKGELNDGQKRRLEDHLARCANCRVELEKARNVMDWVEAAADEEVVSRVESVIAQAVDGRASDIHFEPSPDGSLQVRIRVDGVLQPMESVPPVKRPGVIARLKMLAGMNVGQTSRPQEGRYAWASNGKELDLRMSCVPFIGGEGMVIRILDKSSVFLGLEKFGLRAEHLAGLKELMRQPNGLIVVSGPTGSGKTTTAYSLLQEVRSDQIKMMSIENPVEYQLPGVCQIQVNPAAGYGYAEAMKAVMRSDPDVIYIGDIDDPEAVKVACEAALTGHLVVGQLHADSAIGAVERLLHLGVDPYYLSAALLASTSQRLVRRTCMACRERSTDASDLAFRFLEISQADLDAGTAYKAFGCDGCRQTGYRGRSLLLEMLRVTPSFAAALLEGDLTPKPDWDYSSMRDDARAKVLAGVTTADEARRVLF